MEEDEEVIRKIMKMLGNAGNGRQLTLKSANGQTLRISFEGSAFNDTQPEQDREDEQSPELKHTQEQEEEGDPFSIQDDLKEMELDFHALTAKETEEQLFQLPHIEEEPFELPNIQHIAEVNSDSSKDSLFRELAFPEDPTREEPTVKEEGKKVRKVHLSSKQIRQDNQSVINFFKEEHTLGEVQQEVRPPISLSSSPVIGRLKEELNLAQHRSQTVKQSINLLKERHPQSQQFVQIISSRLDQLQSMQKSISFLNSSISNSLSLGFQSFDVSMLSFHRSLSDPLCSLMAQFLHKGREQGKSSQITVPSSFLFLYSQPLVEGKRQVEPQIDYFQEQQAIQKILKEGKCRVDYSHVPATLDKFHYWLTQGAQIVHFCGHGVQSTSNYLLFETDAAEAEPVTGQRLAQLLPAHNALKLVFVASCHSESAGRVFLQAGASHVICVRDQYKILDQACHQFVRRFYLTCINGGNSICEAFEQAKKQLLLTARFSKHECEKFLLLRSHQGQCHQRFQHRDRADRFNDLNPRPEGSKYMLGRVEHYIPRSRQIYEVIQLMRVKKRRYVTIVGQAGLGKSTLARQLVRYVQFRGYFRDGVAYLELARCETLGKVLEVLDLHFFQTPQLQLNKPPLQNALRLAKQIGEKQLLVVLDNCQAIMASQDKDHFKRLTQAIVKHCVNAVLLFTNRYSIAKQIDFCSQALYHLGRLNDAQSRALFFRKAPRDITRKEYEEFSRLGGNNNDKVKEKDQVKQQSSKKDEKEGGVRRGQVLGVQELVGHSFFQFLNGHPEAICLTASLLAERTLSQLHQLLLEPSIGSALSEGAEREGVNRVVATAMRISLGVIQHKYRQAAQMVKVLSLLPNGLQAEMMLKLFGKGWKEVVKRLIGHSLVQRIEKAGCRYYLLHPQVITEVEADLPPEDKMRFHEKICNQLVQRLSKIYKFVGTSSQYSQRAHQLFLVEEDNFRALFLRQLSFIGDKYPLRKFYENLFRFQCEGLGQEEREDFGQKRLSNAEILAQLQANKKKKALQTGGQKREAIDLLMVYYITVLFIVKKVKTSAIDAYLHYALTVSLKKGKYLVVANLLRLRACVLLVQNKDTDAKLFFQAAHAEFAQLGCGLGSACCEAALGYIKLSESQYAPAKKNLENALKYYEQIPHPFGKHYLNRWLCSLKSKMNKEERELINHKLQAQKLLKETKENLRSNNLSSTSFVKHKFGYFAFRFLFDNISLFLEATFEVDLRPKFINQQIKKHVVEKPTTILEDIYNQEKDDQFDNVIKTQVKPQFKYDLPTPVPPFKADGKKGGKKEIPKKVVKEESLNSGSNISNMSNLSNNMKQQSFQLLKTTKTSNSKLKLASNLKGK